MTSTMTITCPECGTEQAETAPYCQNCGYRVRPKKRGGETLTALKRSSSVAESNTLLEGVRAVKKPATATRAEEGGHYEQAEKSEEEVEADVSIARHPMVAKRKSRNKIMVALVVTISICGLAMIVLNWVYYQSRSIREWDRPMSELAVDPPRIITIEEGPFLRGLSDEEQSFLMQLCDRLHHEGGEYCERERLLQGEFPQQTVQMPTYKIDSGPVRTMDYQRCVKAVRCDPLEYDSCDIWTPQGLQIGVRMPRVLQREEGPVVCVDRDDAQKYCRWKGGDLPTHNQWEKAARGPDGPLFPWGDYWEADRANWGEMDIMRSLVSGKLDGYAWTSPPGAFAEGRSPYGVDDMAGNVAQWVRGTDELQGHVRGGSWVSNPFELRTTAQISRRADSRRTDTGFRCVYSAP